jgi:DNA-binding NarL/FixJ family response regulator
MVRSGFRLILESQPGITVAAEAADGLEAVAFAQSLRPELFISLSTVKTHITRIRDKHCVRNRVEIAAWSWGHRITRE